MQLYLNCILLIIPIYHFELVAHHRVPMKILSYLEIVRKIRQTKNINNALLLIVVNYPTIDYR